MEGEAKIIFTFSSLKYIIMFLHHSLTGYLQFGVRFLPSPLDREFYCCFKKYKQLNNNTEIARLSGEFLRFSTSQVVLTLCPRRELYVVNQLPSLSLPQIQLQTVDQEADIITVEFWDQLKVLGKKEKNSSKYFFKAVRSHKPSESLAW